MTTSSNGSGHPSGRASTRVSQILIVDDHPMLRRGLAALISYEPDMATCGEADDAATTLEMVKKTNPSLVIIDIAMKDTNGLELVKQLKALHPDLRMLVCSMHDESLFAERALRAGAMGYINKERAIDDVVAAIRCVISGRIYLSERMADRLLRRVRGGEEELAETPIDQLTDRELEVFELIGSGLSTAEIATRLHLSPKTIDAHRQKIKRKLEVESTTELTRVAVEWALARSQGHA